MTPERERPAPPGNGGNRPSHDYCTSTSEFIGPCRRGFAFDQVIQMDNRPQESHADLGLVDDDNTEDMRVVDRCPGCVRVSRVQPCFPGCGTEGMFLW